jgi:hypothetical protein
MFPNIVGQYDQGFDRGRQQLATRLAGQAFTAQPDQQQAALGQLASVDPGTAMQMQGQLAQQAKAQQVDHNAKLNGAARFMLDAVNSKDPARIQGAWSAVSPYLSQLTGKQAPPQWDDAMLPAVYQTIANTGGMPEQKPIQLSSGAQLVDQTGKVLADNPAEQKDSGEIATIKALQSDPSLMSTYRQMHPVSSAGGMGRAPSGYRFTQDGGLEAIPGGPADQGDHSAYALTPSAVENAAWNVILTGHAPAIGRGKEGIAQRTAIYNRMAEIAKDAGVSPAELATTAGRNKALQTSLANLQKQTDMMQKSEKGFQNNMQLALELSNKVDRTGAPLLNKWLLGGRAALGDPDVAALDAAITTAATDYARIMSGQTGAGGTPISTAEEARNLIRKELSHKQFSAVADVLYRDIQGQHNAVDSQRQTILGAMQQFGQGQPSPYGSEATAHPQGDQPAPASVQPNGKSGHPQAGVQDFSHLWGN